MISSIRNTTSFQGSFKKDYIDYTKYAHFPSVKVIPVLKDENIKSLLDDKSITMADIFLVVNDIAKICKDYSIKEILESLKNPNTFKFISKYHLRLAQAPLVANLSDKQIKAFEDSLQELNNPELEKTLIFKLQNENGYLISAETKEVFDKEFGTSIYFKITTSPEGYSQISRNETNLKDYTLSRLKQNGSASISKTKFFVNGESVQTQTLKIIEIKSDCIICSRLSDKLSGVYEITKYNFSDYPQDYDLLSAIQDDSVVGGIPLSEISEDEDFVEYKENIEQNGINSKRCYTEAKDGSYKQYEYSISQNNDSILDIRKTWHRVSDDITITTFGDKTYMCDFSNPKKIKITDTEGHKAVIDISQKMRSLSLDFIKSLDALTLLNIDVYTKEVKSVQSDTESAYNRLSEIIKTTQDCFALEHELGHAIESELYYSKPDYNKLRDELLINYQEEFSRFKNISNSSMQEIIEYFSNISASDGLDEFIAETNAILNTLINKDFTISQRASVIIRYFPKTIASAAKLLGYNN